MEIANLADVKNGFSRYIERVRRGERVRITVRGVPVAELGPIPPSDDEEDALLDELARTGVVRRGTGGISKELLKHGPRVKGDLARHVVRVEREEGH